MKKLFAFRSLSAWLLSIPATFLAVGFLDRFYSSPIEIFFITLLIHTTAAFFVDGVLPKDWSRKVGFPVVPLLYLVMTVFILYLFRLAGQYPHLFDEKNFILDAGSVTPFFLAIPFTLPFLMVLLKYHKNDSIVIQWLEENAYGILLAGFFFFIYLMLASIFNQPAFDVDDIFFDSDGLLWRMRFTTPEYQDYYGRSVHPFILIIVRPLVWLISLLLRGDRLYASFMLMALAGAMCVFLSWYFVKYTTANSTYGMLMGSLLGASTAHLVFGSLIETYILLTAVMLLYLVMLLKNSPLYAMVGIGLISFGITITNFVQTLIAHLSVKRNLKQWVKYGVLVGVFVIPLALLNNAIYPNAQPYFFIPASLTKEAGNTFSPSIARGIAVLRVMFLHSMVAPSPLILKEEIPFLKVWMFKAASLQVGEYDTWQGTAVAIIWIVFFLSGFFIYLKRLKSHDHRFPLAFVVILAFNFFLHLQYGKDVFLYATNWTYAIILLLAIAWQPFAEKRGLQFFLLLFLMMILWNNMNLISTMLSTAAIHLH